jgi:hypothetical protein
MVVVNYSRKVAVDCSKKIVVDYSRKAVVDCNRRAVVNYSKKVVVDCNRRVVVGYYRNKHYCKQNYNHLLHRMTEYSSMAVDYYRNKNFHTLLFERNFFVFL